MTETTRHSERTQLLIKRIFDVTSAGLLLIFFMPMFGFLWVLIRCTSAGPAIFRQRRVGLLGREFVIYKFRTMYENAESELKAHPELMEWSGPTFRVRNDPRVTRIGTFLRRFNLDELPQLINVLSGDMSLVGPRPHLVEEAARYETWHERRLLCKPGLTGLWQIEDRHHLDFAESIRLDLRYVDEWSLWLDLRILAKTVPALLSAL